MTRYPYPIIYDGIKESIFFIDHVSQYYFSYTNTLFWHKHFLCDVETSVTGDV